MPIARHVITSLFGRREALHYSAGWLFDGIDAWNAIRWRDVMDDISKPIKRAIASGCQWPAWTAGTCSRLRCIDEPAAEALRMISETYTRFSGVGTDGVVCLRLTIYLAGEHHYIAACPGHSMTCIPCRVMLSGPRYVTRRDSDCAPILGIDAEGRVVSVLGRRTVPESIGQEAWRDAATYRVLWARAMLQKQRKMRMEATQ